MMKHSAALICVTLSFAAAQAEESRKIFPAAGLSALDVRTEGGNIRVEGSDGQEIRVEVSNQDSDKCEITMKPKGRALVVKAKSKTIWFWKSGCAAGFQVLAPKNLSLEASSGSGEVLVTDLSNHLTLSAGSGEIKLHDVAGNLTARLGSGNLQGNARSSQVRILSGSGDVSLGGLIGSVNVQTGSGDISLKWAEAPKSGDVDIKAGSGDISLTLPENAKLQTHILTGSGHIRNEIGETESAEFRVAIKSGSGDVKIGKPFKNVGE